MAAAAPSRPPPTLTASEPPPNLDDLQRNVPHSVTTEAPRVRRHYRDLENALVEYIEQADAVVGAVAWLTSARVLAALASRRAAPLVVHADSWISRGTSAFNEQVRAAYLALPRFAPWDEAGRPHALIAATPLAAYTPTSPGHAYCAVRCVGTGAARMHRKMFVFLRFDAAGAAQPYATWSGSYNPTHNGARSLDDALYVESASLARHDLEAWALVYAASCHLGAAHRWREARGRIAQPPRAPPQSPDIFADSDNDGGSASNDETGVDNADDADDVETIEFVAPAQAQAQAQAHVQAPIELETYTVVPRAPRKRRRAAGADDAATLAASEPPPPEERLLALHKKNAEATQIAQLRVDARKKQRVLLDAWRRASDEFWDDVAAYERVEPPAAAADVGAAAWASAPSVVARYRAARHRFKRDGSALYDALSARRRNARWDAAPT